MLEEGKNEEISDGRNSEVEIINEETDEVMSKGGLAEEQAESSQISPFQNVQMIESRQNSLSDFVSEENLESGDYEFVAEE